MVKLTAELGVGAVVVLASLASRVGGWFGVVAVLIAATIVIAVASLLVSLDTATKVNTFLEQHADKSAKDD